MTPKEFLSQPPIVANVLGQEISLMPTILPGGGCCYKSPPLEFWIKGPDGRQYRTRGRWILNCTHSKNWPRK